MLQRNRYCNILQSYFVKSSLFTPESIHRLSHFSKKHGPDSNRTKAIILECIKQELLITPTRLSVCLVIGLIYRELYVRSVSSGMNYGVVSDFAGALEDSELALIFHAVCWDFISLPFQWALRLQR